MPRRVNKKCLHCANLSVEEAVELHGAKGDNCWDPKTCHRRRSHYRKRDDINAIRRRLRRGSVGPSLTEQTEAIEIIPPQPPAAISAVLVLYRQHPNAPVHAVAAEVWKGNQKLANVEPIHCMGMRADKVTAYIKELLTSLGQQFPVTRFEDVVKEIPVEQCPIANCPLKI
ncbi:MAG TPA: hypothetical protein IGS53_16985 [Leptolyngbyaceae cyanobacterium M33_DOE_097]|uniref:Uncharacterized protein n=1 Tax=Oscillatoriales cyanobacterium SpSt-418 TaxID=2282169 RepID=A0A7C3KI04_9CYAN|nr:hypothetical protein [Leptolyngbyaceae cyanobacterium M33_DOE_097]